jgi:hypothetical protein
VGEVEEHCLAVGRSWDSKCGWVAGEVPREAGEGVPALEQAVGYVG